jgi:hypothetical protein
LTLWEETLENRVVRKVFDCTREEVRGVGENCIEEISSFIYLTKYESDHVMWRMRWAGHISSWEK